MKCIPVRAARLLKVMCAPQASHFAKYTLHFIHGDIIGWQLSLYVYVVRTGQKSYSQGWATAQTPTGIPPNSEVRITTPI